MSYCLICGSPYNNDNRYCQRCLREISTYDYKKYGYFSKIEEKIREKELWVDVEPPPHKDDF